MSIKYRSGGIKNGGMDDEPASTFMQILNKAIKPKSDWPEKDELLDVLYWGRQVVSGCLGVLWGLVPLHGLLAIALYVAVSSVLGHLYVTQFQKVDEDLVGGFWDVAKEGFGAAFATFIIAWVVVYSGLHATPIP